MDPPASPDEGARWRHELRHLDPARQEAVIGMLAEAIATCPLCGRAVRRCDPRELTDDGLAHLACTGREPPLDPPTEGYEEAKRREERKLEALRREAAARTQEGRLWEADGGSRPDSGRGRL